jgi:hypothetical protein
MKTFSLATLFLPEWAPTVGGCVRRRRLDCRGESPWGAVAAMLLLTELVLAPLLAPWLETLPTWGLLIFAAVMVVVVLHQVVDFLFGREVAGHVTGTYLVRLLDALLLGPFRLLARLLRSLRHLG